MQKLQPLQCDAIYLIFHSGSGGDNIFFERANYEYFSSLAERHLSCVCEILDIGLKQNRVDLVVRIRSETEIPPRYRGMLHLPFSNLFNSYTKSINKRYKRQGSLFRRRFGRKRIEDFEMGI